MNNLCVLPFNSLSINSLGQIRPCCSVNGAYFTSVIQKLDADNIINSPEIIKIREDFLKGVKNSSCDRCWKMESIGNESFRQLANGKAYGIKDNTVIKFQKSITYDSLQYLDITLGNKCNLACRMCNPASSSLLARQWKTIGIDNENPVDIEFDTPARNKILDIINRSPNLNYIYMLGGEPLVSDFHDEITDLLIKKNRAKDVTLQYNTNLNIDIDRMLDCWQQFKNIDLGISIDGSTDTYEYIRWPGKWNKLKTNIKSVVEYQKTNKNIRSTIATTVQNLNIDNLYDLISRIRSISDFNFYFIPITGTNQLHFIPADVLVDARKQLTEFNSKEIWRIGELLNMIDTAIPLAESLKTSAGFNQYHYEISHFFDMQKNYDQHRNQNLFEFRSYFKEIANLFGIEAWQLK